MLCSKLPADIVAGTNKHLLFQKVCVSQDFRDILVSGCGSRSFKTLQWQVPAIVTWREWGRVPILLLLMSLSSWSHEPFCKAAWVSPSCAIWLLPEQLLQERARQKPHYLLWLSPRSHTHPFYTISWSSRSQLYSVWRGPRKGTNTRRQELWGHSGGWLPSLYTGRVCHKLCVLLEWEGAFHFALSLPQWAPCL